LENRGESVVVVVVERLAGIWVEDAEETGEVRKVPQGPVALCNFNPTKEELPWIFYPFRRRTQHEND
jgi:hypothetical protein